MDKPQAKIQAQSEQSREQRAQIHALKSSNAVWARMYSSAEEDLAKTKAQSKVQSEQIQELRATIHTLKKLFNRNPYCNPNRNRNRNRNLFTVLGDVPWLRWLRAPLGAGD